MSLSEDQRPETGPLLLRYRVTLCICISCHPPPPSLRYKKQIPFTHQISLKRDKLHCYRKTCSHQSNEEREFHPRKLIIHRKLNEHARGFSTSDQWSNLKEFMSASACVSARRRALIYLWGPEDPKVVRMYERLRFVQAWLSQSQHLVGPWFSSGHRGLPLGWQTVALTETLSPWRWPSCTQQTNPLANSHNTWKELIYRCWRNYEHFEDI